MQGPTIETERLRLRMFRPEDVDGLAALYADPDVMQYVGSGQTLGREWAERAIERAEAHWRDQGFGPFAIELKDSGEFAGRGGLNYLDNTPEVEVGYILARPYWGKGYATEATKAWLAYGFEQAGLGRIVAITYQQNFPSQRVLHKAGLKYEGLRRYYNLAEEVCYFAITREMYEHAKH